MAAAPDMTLDISSFSNDDERDESVVSASEEEEISWHSFNNDDAVSITSSTSSKNGDHGSKKTLSMLVLAVVFIVLALAVDAFLLFRMSYRVKTIDTVLGQDSPDVSVRVGMEVSSPMLFSSINVNSFDCHAFHNSPDDDDYEIFAKLSNSNHFQTKNMVDNFNSPEDSFRAEMDILVSEIDFVVLKRVLRDIFMTTNRSSTRADCSLYADLNLFGIATFPIPKLQQSYHHNCSDCETQKKFKSTDYFMGSFFASMLSDKNGETPDRSKYSRSITFSEDSDQIVFTINKSFDVAGYFSDLERLNVDVPAGNYIFTSKDRDEFWSTRSSPFSVDLMTPGGCNISSDIITTCKNIKTMELCEKVTDPVGSIMQDFWNGHADYKVASAANIVHSGRDSRFSILDVKRKANNFVESLFGIDVHIKFDYSFNHGVVEDVSINRKLSDVSVGASAVTSTEIGSLIIEFGEENIDFFRTSVYKPINDAFPISVGAYANGFQLTLDVSYCNQNAFNVSVRKFRAPVIGDIVGDEGDDAIYSLVSAAVEWEHDGSSDEVSIDYSFEVDDGEFWTVSDDIVVSYGDVHDEFDFGDLLDVKLGKVHWVDTKSTENDWKCKELSHEDVGISMKFCRRGNNFVNITLSDTDMKTIAGFEGEINERSISFLPPRVNLDASGLMKLHEGKYFEQTMMWNLNFHSALSLNKVDVIIDFEQDGNEVLLLRGLVGWNCFSYKNFEITRTDFLLRENGYETFRTGMNALYVRFDSLFDIEVGLEDYFLSFKGDEVVRTTTRVLYRDDFIDILFLLLALEEEQIYVRAKGLIDYDSRYDWDVDMDKVLVRYLGDEKISMWGKGSTHEVNDAEHDSHVVITARMFLEKDQVEYINLQHMHADLVADADLSNVSMSCSMDGIFDRDGFFNGTLFLDKRSTVWTISTNNFELESLELTDSPSASPTEYIYESMAILEMDTDLIYRTAKQEFDNDQAAQEASKSAFKESLNQSYAEVSISNTQSAFYDDSGGRRRLTLVEGVKVTYQTTVIAEKTGLDATTLYDDLREAITSAVATGVFHKKLDLAFDEFDVSKQFEAEAVADVAPAVITVVTQSPTHQPSAEDPVPSSAPTSSPTIAPSITQSPTRTPPSVAPTDEAAMNLEDSTQFSTTNIVIIAVIVPVGLLLCASLGYFAASKRDKRAVSPYFDPNFPIAIRH